MAKNKGATLSLRSMSREQLEAFAKKSMDEGKLRIARDAYKELVRIDRNRFLPDLLRCYNLLAGKMAANGQMEEARGVLVYIKELGGEQAVTIDIDDFGKAESASDSSIIDFGTVIANGELAPQELKYHAADSAIAGGALPADMPESFSTALSEVKKALTAVCDRNYAEAVDTLKPIPYDSPFSQWKLLVRGMCRYYQGDDENALKTFEKIVAFTTPAKLARSFLIALDRKKYLTNEDSDREEALINLCLLSGYSHLAGVLPRAQFFWMTGRQRDSIRHILRTMPGFPSLNLDIAGSLTALCFNFVHHLDNERADRMLEVLEGFSPYTERISLKHLLTHRAFCMKSATFSDIPESELIDMWNAYMAMHRKLFGPDNELDAEAYLFLGLLFDSSGAPQDLFKMFAPAKKRGSPHAEACLKKAVELSKSRDAYMALLSHYRSGKRKTDYRRIIEEAVHAFPDDKEILREAGIMAINRSAFYKGVEYLGRAYLLDPIDSTLRENLVIACLNAARTAMKTKNGVAKMRQYIGKAGIVCVNGTGGFNGELCYIAMRGAAFEFLAGNEKEGLEQIEYARAKASDIVSLDFFGYIVFKIYRVPLDFRVNLDAEAEKWFSSPPTVENAAAFVKVLLYARGFNELYMLENDEARCVAYCIGAMKIRKFTAHDVRLFFEFALERKDRKSAREIVAVALAADPRDPRYRFFSCKLEIDNKTVMPRHTLQKALKKLRGILPDAKKTADAQTVSAIEKEIARLEELARDPFGFPFPRRKKFPFDIPGSSQLDLFGSEKK